MGHVSLRNRKLMQDGTQAGPMRDPTMPTELLDSMRELNRRFLELIADQPDGWNAPKRSLLPIPSPTTPSQLSARVAPLTPAQKAAVASCPYALFDLRFHDDTHWQERLRGNGIWRVAEASAVPTADVAITVGADARTVDFVRLVLFFAWHVASSGRLAAQLLLGMRESTVAAFRSTTIDCLPALANREASHLTARWNDCVPYWRALTGAAGRQDTAELRKIQLYGLQLAAAARLLRTAAP